jgi:hypothetical protein
MFTPDEREALNSMEDRLRTLQAQKEEAQRWGDRARVDALEAQIDQLDADYDSVIRAIANVP